MKKSSGMSNLDIVRSYVAGERPFIQVGYDDNLENANRKDGEEWIDSLGRSWKYQHGYKVRISKKSKIVNEKRCTECNADTRWGNYLDDRVWPKTGLCYDCFTERETKYKIAGVWDIYNKLRDLKNEKTAILDLKTNFSEAKDYCENHTGDDVAFQEEDGTIEKWIGKEDFTDILKQINEDLDIINKRLSVIDEEIEELEIKWDNYEKTKN